MRSLTKLAFCFFAPLAAVASVAACVGDDPAPATSGTTPGNDAAIGTGTDSSTPLADGSSPGTDSSTDGGVDAAPPPLDVRTLPGLRLWLESTKGLTKAAVGTDLVSWRDSSDRWLDGGAGAPAGGAHLATPVAYQGGGAVYPGVVANGIGSRPSVTFETGPKLAIPNHDDFNPGTGDFVIAAVGSVTSGGGPFWNLTKANTAPTGVFFGTSMFCNFLGGAGAQPTCTSPEFTPSTAPHVFVVRRKVAQAIFRVDGTSRGTYDFGANNPNLGVLTFQQDSAFIGGALKGQLSELVLLIGTTADADVDTLEGHLKKKYAIP